MAEYVKKEDIGLTDFEIILCNGDYKEALKMLLDKIENMPAANVRPVVQGRWIEFETDTPPRRNRCSECGYITNPWLAHVYNFCPNCGAKMEES